METPIYHLEKVLHSKQEEARDFVGPLDLILYLLSKNKIEIKDISVSQILDQYLVWMSKRKELDLEVASEFIAMAAHLLYIKTRMLLSEQDEEALSEMELLIADLEQRRSEEMQARIALVLPELERLHGYASGYYTTPCKPREDAVYTPEYAHVPEELLRAMERMAERKWERLPPPLTAFRGVVGREPYPIEQKAAELMLRLERGILWFTPLLEESQSRSELVATFLVVLELCRNGTLLLRQEGEELMLSVVQGSTDARAPMAWKGE